VYSTPKGEVDFRNWHQYCILGHCTQHRLVFSGRNEVLQWHAN